MQIYNKTEDLILIRFPIIFPLIYFFILKFFPSYENYLIIFVLFVLAEPHFAATWPFLINKTNSEYIKEKKINFIYIPLLIALISLVSFFLVKNIFLLIFFAANIFHVTRQSFGICKLYCKDISEIKFQENFIYLINLLFFSIAF